MPRELFFTADTHFGHQGILRHAHRPWTTVEEMDEALVSNWNNTVPRKSDVYIVGDFAWRDHAKYLNRLHGRKHLILGSHDRMSKQVQAQFTGVHQTLMLKLPGNAMGEEFVYMQHCCPRVWEKSHYGVPCLFGHSHGRLTTLNLSFDVGVDTLKAQYAPISLDGVLAHIAERKVMMEEAARVIVGPDGKKLYRQDDVAYLEYVVAAGEAPLGALDPETEDNS